MVQSIQLVLQAAETGSRRNVPGDDWTPKSTLQEVMDKMSSELQGVSLEGATLRYIQTTIEQSKWASTTLQSIGLSGRSLLILKLASNKSSTASKPAEAAAAAEPMQVDNDGVAQQQPGGGDDGLQLAVDTLLKNNFDVDTKPCIVTLIKVIDNVLQKPDEPKVRSIRLQNAAFQKKVVQRKGGGKCVCIRICERPSRIWRPIMFAPLSHF